MSGIVLSSKEEALVTPPFLYEVTNEVDGVYIDFRRPFKSCTDIVLFSDVESKKILNLEIQKRKNDYVVQSNEELDTLINLYLGKYESPYSSRKELIDLLMNYWVQSKNFRERSASVLEDIKNGNVKDKYKVINNFPNDLPITNLREFYRFSITEYYKPIESTVLHRLYKVTDKIFKTDIPLVYYTHNRALPQIKVMFGNNLFEPMIKPIRTGGA